MSEAKPLPPDTDGLNGQRSEWVHEGLKAFAVATNMNIAVEADDVAADFLADLMHWCDRNGQDFEQLLARGRNHYSAETTEAR